MDNNYNRIHSKPCCDCLLSLSNLFIPRWGKGCSVTGTRSILFINDIPSLTEYKLQQHYVGRSTIVLNYYIERFHLTGYCYKTHLVKCYATMCKPEYIKKCVKHLIRDIKECDPILIVTCGKTVYETLTDRDIYSMNKIVNKPIKFANSVLFPIFSPSYIKRSKRFEEYDRSFNLIADLYARVNDNYALFR